MNHYHVRSCRLGVLFGMKTFALIAVLALFCATPNAAQAQQIPPNASPGAILGWELNMSRTYQQQQNLLLKPLPGDTPEEPLIQYEGVPVNTGDQMPLLLRDKPPAQKPTP